MSMFEEGLHGMPPHGEAIGMVLAGRNGRKILVKVPYAAHLVGDPDTGVIHGGVITATLDNASGWAVRCHEDWGDGLSMATLDIRIDYMKPAVPDQALMVEAECFRMTRNIAFVRALAFHDDPEDLIASSMASFMLGTPSGPRP